MKVEKFKALHGECFLKLVYTMQFNYYHFILYFIYIPIYYHFYYNS